MADSTKKPIAKVAAGDLVISVDRATGSATLATVERRTRERAPRIVVLHLDNGEAIETTPRQMFVAVTGQFVPARSLEKGHRLRTIDGRIIKVARVGRRLKAAYVHTLLLRGGANYHVGSAALRVPIVKEDIHREKPAARRSLRKSR
jgi:hypothetical protein